MKKYKEYNIVQFKVEDGEASEDLNKAIQDGWELLQPIDFLSGYNRVHVYAIMTLGRGEINQQLEENPFEK